MTNCHRKAVKPGASAIGSKSGGGTSRREVQFEAEAGQLMLNLGLIFGRETSPFRKTSKNRT